jgi:hypothetical protein
LGKVRLGRIALSFDSHKGLLALLFRCNLTSPSLTMKVSHPSGETTGKGSPGTEVVYEA